MNIQQIIYIIEINKYNSFSVAANSLYISQPRLSQAVKDLETELGFEIFERNRKGIIGPTLKGYEFIHSAKKVLRDFNALSSYKESAKQTFRLTTTLIPQAQDAFIQLAGNHSDDESMNFDMFFCGCFESCDKIKNSNYNLGIVTVINQQLSEWKQYFASVDLVYEELFNCSFYITVHNDSPLAKLRRIRAEQLKNHMYITEKCSKMNDLTLQVYSIFDSLFSNSRVTVSNTDVMYTLVKENNAFTLDSFPLDAHTKKRYGLESVPFDNDMRVHVGYIYDRYSSMNSLTKEYINILKNSIKTIPQLSL